MAYSIPYALLLIMERWIFVESPLILKIRNVCENNIMVYLYVVLFCVWFVVRNIYGI